MSIVAINYVNKHFFRHTNKCNETKIANLNEELKDMKTQLEKEKAKKKENQHKKDNKKETKEPFHSEIDWKALAQCFPRVGADSDFVLVA